MSLTLSKRVSHMSNFLVMGVLSRANELERKLQSENPSAHNKVLRLEVDQPRTPPPKAVLESLSRASTSYTAALGTPELKKAMALHYKKWYSVKVAPTVIAVTTGAPTGASGVFVATFLSCFDSGDRVAVSVPGYPCYKQTLLAMGVQVVELAVDDNTNFQPTVMQLSAEHETCALDGIVIASPSNPTGSVLSEEHMRSLARFCDDNSIRLVVDEIYHGIGEQLPVIAMCLHDQVVVISSLSKFWCMTGFRVGWLATRDASLMQAIERTIENMCLCGACGGVGMAARRRRRQAAAAGGRRRRQLIGIKVGGEIGDWLHLIQAGSWAVDYQLGSTKGSTACRALAARHVALGWARRRGVSEKGHVTRGWGSFG